MPFDNLENKGKSTPPTPAWFKWLILGFIGFALMQTLISPPKAPKDSNSPLPLAEGSTLPPKESEPLGQPKKSVFAALEEVEDFTSRLFPTSGGIDSEDKKIGKGPLALCGKTVSLRYSAFLPDGSQFDSNRSASGPLTFRIGERSVLPVIEQGVDGMRVGGIREVRAYPDRAIDTQKFPHLVISPDSRLRFELHLEKVTPILDESALPPRMFEVKLGDGKPIQCGDKAYAHITLWNLEGKKIFSTPSGEPLAFLTGSGAAPYGLELGVLEMRPGGKRTMIVPPAYQKPLRDGNDSNLKSPFPGERVVIMDIEIPAAPH